MHYCYYYCKLVFCPVWVTWMFGLSLSPDWLPHPKPWRPPHGAWQPVKVNVSLLASQGAGQGCARCQEGLTVCQL